MTIEPRRFATLWCEAWNAHDLDRLLAHFHDDVVFTSPAATRIVPESAGRLEGKAALRAYWSEGLRRVPDLRFTVEDVTFGVDTLVIRYRNQSGVAVNEVLIFDSDKVRFGAGTYPVEH